MKNIDSEVLLSFIVPVYNSALTLNECFDSIFLAKSYFRYEVIIIYDDSSDNSLDIIKSYQKTYKNLRFYKSNSNGVGVARNIGINYSLGSYITFIDADDIVSSFFQNKIHPFLRKDEFSDVDFFIFNSIFFDHNRKVVKKYLCNINNQMTGLKIFEESFFSRKIILVPWGKIFKKSFLVKNNIKFQHVNEWEDVLFIRQAAFFAGKVVGISNYLYFARISNVSRSRAFPKNFFTEARKTLNLEKDFLMKSNAGPYYLDLFYMHSLKILTIFLIRASILVNSKRLFFQHYQHATQNEFIFFYRQWHKLPLKFQILSLIVINKYVLFIFGRILRIFKLKVY